jgi:ABC-type polysaccharide/polyol phosphate export permease
MLENLYQTFGIFGSLIVALIIFLLIIFWVAGIAGLTDRSQRATKTWQIVLSVLFPPYPVIWLIYDMIRQYKAMHLE